MKFDRSYPGIVHAAITVIAVAMALWIVGHAGWAYYQLAFDDQSWLRWHTLFSICAGIGPLIALLARPHRGPRAGFVAPTAMTIGAYWLLAIFLYSYFVLAPSLLPEARPAAQARLLYFVQSNRLLLLAAMAAAVWFARGTDWRPTYLRMAVGVGIGFGIDVGPAIVMACRPGLRASRPLPPRRRRVRRAVAGTKVPVPGRSRSSTTSAFGPVVT